MHALLVGPMTYTFFLGFTKIWCVCVYIIAFLGSVTSGLSASNHRSQIAAFSFLRFGSQGCPAIPLSINVRCESQTEFATSILSLHGFRTLCFVDTVFQLL